MPSQVDKYYDEVKRGNPNYSDEQAWATAWSIVCKNGLPGSDSCSEAPSEYLKGQGKSAGMIVRVAARSLEAREFDSPEGLKDYLHEHPGADPANHSVKKHEKPKPKEEGKAKDEGHDKDEHEEKPKKSWKDRLKGLSDGAIAFVKSAPKAVQKFIEDDSYRRSALQGAHKALVESPEKLVAAVKKTVKEEIHEFKEAGQGIAAVLKGGKMSKHQKKAFKTVAFHMAIGVTAAALTASGPVGAAGAFAKGLARHIAAKSVSNALGHIHVLDELGHIGHGVKHLLEHVASDQRGPEAVLNRYIQAAKGGKTPDPEDVIANFVTACVAKELGKLDDAGIKDAIEEASGGKKEDKKDKTAHVVERFLEEIT